MKIETAMILAAGYGRRLAPLTGKTPKALIKVGDGPLLAHALDRLAGAGVARAVVNVHHKAESVTGWLAQRRGAPEIVVSDERERLLGTGGALIKAAAHLGRAPFYIHNCDVVWREAPPGVLAVMAAHFDPAAMDVLLLLVETARAQGYQGRGDFAAGPDGRLAPGRAAGGAAFVYAGVQIMHPRLLAAFARSGAAAGAPLPRLWEPALESGRAFGHVLQAGWVHAGTHEGLRAARALWGAPGGLSA